jgi:hypothetical protein
MPHITTQYHLAPKLYRQIGLKLHLRAANFKIFLGGPPHMQHAWVPTFGKHIVRHPQTKFLDPRLELDPSLQKILDPPLLWRSRSYNDDDDQFVVIWKIQK